MSYHARKAGRGAITALGKGTKRVPVHPPRAVTAEEASRMQPARESTKTTMMPWKHWISRWVETTFPSAYEQLRKTFLFEPNDIYDQVGAPLPTREVKISATDPNKTALYRYPSPGSQPPARVPSLEADQDPYDVAYFKRDTRRRYEYSEYSDPHVEMAKLELMGNPDDPDIKEEKERVQKGPTSSKGNKGVFATGPTNFDPTGLRSTMSVTWSALEASLDKYMPDHLPEPSWVGREAQIIAWYEERGLPVPVGEYYKPLKVPIERRIAKW